MMRRVIRSALILAGTALALIPLAGVPGAANDCTTFGAAGNNNNTNCVISGPTTPQTGAYTIGDLTITGSGVLKVGPAGITINLSKTAFPTAQGNLDMLKGSVINGDVFTAIAGAPITINADGNIHLAGGDASTPGANIHSNSVATSCAGGNKGGKITLIANHDGPPFDPNGTDLVGDFTMDPGTTTFNGSKISSIASCGLGEIIIKGVSVSIDGDVLSQGTSTKGRGGPISVDAACKLTITDFGSVVSLGQDPGADLVHLSGGCDVTINGLVASNGAGHIGGVNRCQGTNAPPLPLFLTNPPIFSYQACVEVWAGDSLTIDSTRPIIGQPHNGEISADTNGITGVGWINLFSRGPITLKGDTVAPFVAHANQGLSNGHGGVVTVRSKTGAVTITNLGVQASDPSPGGQGGLIDIAAHLNVILTGSTNEAQGANSGGGSQRGGQIFIRSFGGTSTTGTIIANTSSFLNVNGDTANGLVNLTACDPAPNSPPTPFGFPATGVLAAPGIIVPATIVATPHLVCADGEPTFPVGTVLPPCKCPGPGCPCVTSFSCTATNVLSINGNSLTAVTSVLLSSVNNVFNCDPASGSSTTILVQTPTLITLDLTKPPVPPPGTYKIITVDGAGGSCCSGATIDLPCK